MESPQTVFVSKQMMELIENLRTSGLYGHETHDVISRLLEERLRQLVADNVFLR